MMKEFIHTELNASAVIVMLLFVCTTCRYKPLCYDHNHVVDVRVLFDWSEASGANVEGMSVYMHELTLDADQRYDVSGMDGGVLPVERGEYDVCAWNYDAESILIKHLGADHLYAYTRASSLSELTLMPVKGDLPRSELCADQRVCYPADSLWVGCNEYVELPSEEVIPALIIQPHKRTLSVDVTVQNVANLQYSVALGASISSLAGGLDIMDATQDDEPVTVGFPLAKVAPQVLYGSFECFGHCCMQDALPHILTVYAVLADGSKWYYSVDVTREMHCAASHPDNDPNHICITINSLPLPKPITNGSGFQPDVDQWQNIDIEIGM